MHCQRLNESKTSAVVTKFFPKVHSSSNEKKIVAAEITKVFHNVKHGLSYLSADCGKFTIRFTLILYYQKIEEWILIFFLLIPFVIFLLGNKLDSVLYSDSKIPPKIHLGRTKMESIAENVLAPYSEELVVRKIASHNTPFSIATDA